MFCLPADDIGDASAMRSPWWDAASVPLSRGLRSYASAVELNGFIYIFGGVDGDDAAFEILNTTLIYDEANNSWSRGANMPGPRFGSAVATGCSGIWGIRGGTINYTARAPLPRYCTPRRTSPPPPPHPR